VNVQDSCIFSMKRFLPGFTLLDRCSGEAYVNQRPPLHSSPVTGHQSPIAIHNIPCTHQVR